MQVLVVSADARLGSWLLRTVADAGWTARVAASLPAAAELAQRWSPDLVIADVAAADLVGSTADALLCRSTRLVVVTTRRIDREVEAALAAGADGYITCPVGPHELIARLRAVSRRPSRLVHPFTGTVDPVVVLGEMTLDRVSRQVSVRSIPIHVTGHEYDLVERLMVAAPMVVSREELLRSLWGDDSAGARLDVHLRRIRYRLEEVEGWRRIETVRGVGFRMLREVMPDRRPAFTPASAPCHDEFDRPRERSEP